MPPLPHPRWLLLSDIHFRVRDLERTTRTAEWIVSLSRQTPGISRAVICGDVLTSRSTQPTAVISAAYRFLSDLSGSVPHVNVILGNHDLAYRRDYSTTALEALNMSRLRPFVSLHDQVARHTWDGRDVLVLPFREDQSELTAAVADLDPAEAAQTIAFAHLAIHRAVLQRHIVRDDTGDTGHSVRYRGWTGPDHFSALARTFTGHFHSHQTILQSSQHTPPVAHEDRLKGSVTYLGAPLQLTWADVYDEDRGVILLDPATLEHELVVNPHAVGYVTVQGSQILNGDFDASTLQDKHVMVLGNLTRFHYWTARDKLLSLGAQSVREPRPSSTLRDGSNSLAHNSLGATVPVSDRDAALGSSEPIDEPSASLANDSQITIDEQSALSEPDNLRSVQLDPVEHVRDYVQSLDLEPQYEEIMVRLGQRLMLASESIDSLGDDAGYKALIDPSFSMATPGLSQSYSKRVFVAKPRSIVISNFLGVQEECTIDFDGSLGRGLSFVVGKNGSGKSTLIEAIVWCQFGRCIRKGLSVGDVVNDVTGKDCKVSLSFSNGYTITRYRKHKIQGNRVIVSLYGKEQPQFEHGDARSLQAALDELLGIDYDEFIKTVVLGHESAASFLSSTPAERHELIDSALGLSRLDKSSDLSRRLLREIDDDAAALRSKMDAIEHTISLIENRIDNRKSQVQRLRIERESAKKAINLICTQKQAHPDDFKDNQARQAFEEDLNERLGELQLKIKETQEEVDQAQSVVKDIEIREDTAAQELLRQAQIRDSKEHSNVESMLRNIAQTISKLQSYAREATDHISPSSSVNRLAIRLMRIGLISLKRFSRHLNKLLERLKQPDSGRRQNHMDTAKGEEKVDRTEITEGELDNVQQSKERSEGYIETAIDRDSNEQTTHSNALLETNAREARKHLSYSLNYLSELLGKQGVLHDIQAQHQRKLAKMRERERTRAAAHHTVEKKEQEIAIYQKLIEEETSILEEQRSSLATIEPETETLMSTREVFAFWEGSLSRRRTKSAATSFRGYVLEKSLQELNAVASNILLELYENTRHARELTNGMLRTIVAADAESNDDSSDPQTAVLLDQTLGVTKTLSYAKRSGGERKRIDLAVFFALVQILQAQSTHRARYILIDEAFDSLDADGQAAVVRWCLQLMTRTDFQLVVTHSDYLVNTARGSSNDGDDDHVEGQFSVLSATMTETGTKFSHSTL